MLKPNKLNFREWQRLNQPSEDMRYAKPFWYQMSLFDSIVDTLIPVGRNFSDDLVTVQSTHTSKSIKLPVIGIDLADIYGVQLLIRGNFGDYKVSVRSINAIETDFIELFKYDDVVSSVYCEGFPDDTVFGPYSENKSRFTVALSDEYDLHTFIRILNYYLKKKKLFSSEVCNCIICSEEKLVNDVIKRLDAGERVVIGKKVYSKVPNSSNYRYAYISRPDLHGEFGLNSIMYFISGHYRAKELSGSYLKGGVIFVKEG